MPDRNDWNVRRPYALSNARKGQRCNTTTSVGWKRKGGYRSQIAAGRSVHMKDVMGLANVRVRGAATAADIEDGTQTRGYAASYRS